ncbi:FUSC family protein [Parathermosynechococcus lividus]
MSRWLLPSRLQLKHAVKVGIAAGLLAIVCWHANLKMVHYPAMGLVATMLSLNTGETLKNGWGRLGGSLLGGLCTALWISGLGLNPLAGTLAFSTAVLLCETLKLPTMQNQAAAVTAIMAASTEFGQQPWEYASSRVVDNCIGIVIGILVTLCLWPEHPELTLKRSTSAIVAKLQHIYEDVCQALATGIVPQHEATLAALVSQLQQAEATLEASVYGILGWVLVLQNWSDRLMGLRRLRRHLRSLSHLSPALHSSQFRQECQPFFDQLWPALRAKFRVLETHLQGTGHSNPLADSPPPFALLHERLTHLRHQQITKKYPLDDVIHIYQAVHLAQRIDQDLSQLQQEHPPPEPHCPWRWRFKLHPISDDRVRRIIKASVAFALGLVLVSWLQLPSGFYVTLSIAICFQSTLGNSMEAARQRLLGTVVGLFVTEVMIHTLGINALSIGLGMVLIILIAGAIGIPQGYKPGAFLLIVSMMAFGATADTYIWQRFWETQLGIIIVLIVDMAFWRDTAASRLDQESQQNFQRLATLYGGLLTDFTGERSPQERNDLIAAIRKSYRQQLQLRRVTNLESVVGFGLAEKRRQWNIGLSYQLALFSSFLSLDLPSPHPSMVYTILQECQPAVGEVLRAIAHSLHQGLPTQETISAVAHSLHELEIQLVSLRQQNRLREYPLEGILEAFNVLEVLKEVGGDILPTMDPS